MFRLLLCAFTLCTLFYSCSPPEYLSERELTAFILEEKNGLSKSVDVYSTNIRIAYRPTDLLVAQELNQGDVIESQIQAVRNKYNKHYYFTVSFSHAGGEILNAPKARMADFSALLQTISFGMSEVVNLTTSIRDTIPVADYIYSRTFGMGRSTDLLFAFDKSKAVGQKWLKLNIEEFGLGTGMQSFQFKIPDLEKAPKIYNP